MKMFRPLVLTAVAALGVTLAAVSPASAGVTDDRWRLFVKVSNDMRNVTVPGYPQITLQRRGFTRTKDWYCWRDYDLENPPAISPGASGVIVTDVDLRGNRNCGVDYHGWRDVQFAIKEAPDADWVVPEGQGGLRLGFGNETNSAIGRASDNDRCPPELGGGNCFTATAVPNTWWTRPAGPGLFCLRVDSFDANDTNYDTRRRSVLKISVRDDEACNVPRPSRFFPRQNGVPSTSGFPVFGPVKTQQTSARASANQAAPDPEPQPGGTVNLVPNVQAVLSGSALLCAWGIKDFSKAPQACQDAGSDSAKWDLTGLTIPAAIPPDMRPPRFRVVGTPSTSANTGVVICTVRLDVPATSPALTAGCNQTTTWGHQESSKDSKSLKFGQKTSYGTEWKKTFNFFGLSPLNAEFTQKVSIEASFEQQWGWEKSYTRTTQVQTAVNVSTPAPGGRSTVLRVVKTDLSHAYNYEADLMFGIDGKAEPVLSPAATALGMSPSLRQQCAATAMGGGGVTGSMMWIAKQRVDSGTGTENQLLDDINESFSVGGRRCPGFPNGFASLAAVRGPGIGTFSSTGEATEPILNPDGQQAYTDQGVPRYLQTHGIGLTGCVYSTPYPPVARRTLPTARATQTGANCIANIDPNGKIDVADPGALVQGSAGPDRLAATADTDLVVPGPGNDAVVGGPGPLDIIDPSPGNDRLLGGGGADHISGGPGRDFIDAGPGPFTSLGGPGDDRIVQRGSEGHVSGDEGNDDIRTDGVRGGIAGGPGRDVFHISGSVSGAVFDGGAGDDRYEIAPGPGCAAVFERPGEGSDAVVTGRCLGEAPNVEQITLSGALPLPVRTARGRQVLIGNAAGNVIDGGPGRDVLNGAGGDDQVHMGGDAYDTATGGPGADRFIPGGTPSTGYRTGLAPNARSHRITDFSAAEGDRIVLRAWAFGPEVRGLRRAWTVVSDPAPVARSPRPTLLHDPRTGLIAFDRDGSGIRSPRVVAMVPRGTVLTPTTFEIR